MGIMFRMEKEWLVRGSVFYGITCCGITCCLVITHVNGDSSW